MTFRFYNPFARIRFQLDAIKRLTAELARAESRADTFLIQRNHTTNALNLADTKVTKLTRRLIQHAQAVDAHMEERDILIQAIEADADYRVELQGTINAQHAELSDALVTIDRGLQAVFQLADEVAQAQEVIQQQASEIVEVIAYVKAAEAALEVQGIRIVDTPQGPAVQFLDRIAA